MWVSTKPGSTSLPSTLISELSESRRGAIAAIRPSDTPISTGMADDGVTARRKIRSKAVFAVIGRANWGWEGEAIGSEAEGQLQIVCRFEHELFKICACKSSAEL